MKLPILLVLAAAVLLPSCENFPISARITGPNGAVSYSDKTGLGVEIDTGSRK